MTINGYEEEICFDVVAGLQHNVILGLPWLMSHNPTINWQQKTVTFNSSKCQANCFLDRKESQDKSGTMSGTAMNPETIPVDYTLQDEWDGMRRAMIKTTRVKKSQKEQRIQQGMNEVRDLVRQNLDDQEQERQLSRIGQLRAEPGEGQKEPLEKPE